jgi:hypothetical protein
MYVIRTCCYSSRRSVLCAPDVVSSYDQDDSLLIPNSLCHASPYHGMISFRWCCMCANNRQLQLVASAPIDGQESTTDGSSTWTKEAIIGLAVGVPAALVPVALLIWKVVNCMCNRKAVGNEGNGPIGGRNGGDVELGSISRASATGNLKVVLGNVLKACVNSCQIHPKPRQMPAYREVTVRSPLHWLRPRKSSWYMWS